ncbi:PTS fructose transporter subunit IIB [Lachnospiraceae bacterium 54-53]
MKILAITACTAGIAHTYIAKEKLENAAREMGDFIKVETQGSIGVENELTPEEIKEADVILIAADIRVGKERFAGKAVVDIPISMIMKSPKGVISKIHEKLEKQLKE